MSRARFEELRAAHERERDAILPQYVGQLEWPADRLRAERERRMRLLLATAKARSPWHRERLRHVDADAFTEGDLSSIPTMTKDDLMDHFEAVVTDPRLTRDVVDEYVERPPENLYLFDEYLVIASGGSSGRRGVFVYDRAAFAIFAVQMARWRLRNATPPSAPWANLWAPRGAHVSWIAFQVFPPPVAAESIAPTLPIGEIVDRLNALRPRMLSGYASTLALLAGETRAGRLAIAPDTVLTCGEPLLPEARALIESVWPTHVQNYYGMSEGPYAFPCTAGDAMHLPDDLFYLELVDDADRPVSPGDTRRADAAHEPLQSDAAAHPLRGHGPDDAPARALSVRGDRPPHRRAARTERRRLRVPRRRPRAPADHPRAARPPSPRGRVPGAADRARRARPALRERPPVDRVALSATIAAGLRGCGVDDPEVVVEEVPELSRQISGKLKRFVPL